MKKLDYLLQKWRYSVVEPFIPSGSDVLDIGGYDASFLKRIQGKIRTGICYDPHVEEKSDNAIQCIKARFDGDLPFPDNSADVIVMLAVYEHLQGLRKIIADESFRVCRENGLVILTVPSAAVDGILKILKTMRLIEGMSLEEHEHFNPGDTPVFFQEAGFQLVQWKRFQLGFNNLFIFKKSGE